MRLIKPTAGPRWRCVYRDEHTHGFNVQPDPLGRALAAAHRAVEAAPSNHLAHHALACALFFRREIVAFRSAAERTIALNPMDAAPLRISAP